MFALLFAHTILAQSDFRIGYIVTNSLDTLTGLVNYREGLKAFTACEFKKSENDKAETRQPDEISGYGFADDKIFESREIELTDQVKRTVFLEVIVRGTISLYKYEKIYFVQKRGETMHRLENETIEEVVNGTPVRKKTNAHMSILNMLMFDCVGMRSNLQRAVSLHEKPVTSLVEDYNQCMGEPTISFKAEKPWLKVAMGISGGVELATIGFDNDYEPIKHLRGDFDVSKIPLYGISVELKVPRLGERISFVGEVFYLNAKYHLYKISTVQPYTYRDDVTIEINEIKIPLGFRYSLPEKKITPFVNAGLTSIIHLNSGSLWIREAEAGSYFETSRDEALEMKKNQLGIWGGIGAALSISKGLSAFLEVRYEQTDGVAGSSLRSLSTTKSTIQNLDILLGIRLK